MVCVLIQIHYIDTYNHYSEWMTILSQSNTHNNSVYFTPRSSAGFANNARALRGLVAFCLVYNKPLRSIINKKVLCSSMEQLFPSYG